MAKALLSYFKTKKNSIESSVKDSDVELDDHASPIVLDAPPITS